MRNRKRPRGYNKKHLSDEDYEPDNLQTKHQKNKARHSSRIMNKGFRIRYKEVCGEVKGYCVTLSNMVHKYKDNITEDNDVDYDNQSSNKNNIDIDNENKNGHYRDELLLQYKLKGLAAPDTLRPHGIIVKRQLELPSWGHKRLRIYPPRQRRNTKPKSIITFVSINTLSQSTNFKSSKRKGHHKLLQSYENMKLPERKCMHDKLPEHLSARSASSSVTEPEPDIINTSQLFKVEPPPDIMSTITSATIDKLNSKASDGTTTSTTPSETLREDGCSLKAATDDDQTSESMDHGGSKKGRVDVKDNRKTKRKKHRPRVKRDISIVKRKGKLKNDEIKERALKGNGVTEYTVLKTSFSVRKKRTSNTRIRSIAKWAATMIKQDRQLMGTIPGLCDSMSQLSISSISTAEESLVQQDREPTSSSKLGFCDLLKLGKENHTSLMNVSITNPREGCDFSLHALPNHTAVIMGNNKLDLHTMYAIVPASISNKLAKESMETGDQSSMHTTVALYKSTNKSSIIEKQSTQLSTPQETDSNSQLVIYDHKREMILAKSAKISTKLRAKVQMDIENERIWPQLALGGIPQEFEDQQYWEKERGMMKERVELFIQRMQIVQGHRRFSPWEGSIVDSVVGAFLTQNVSDHLSSSAFMSVASRYPAIKRKDKEAPLQEIVTPCCEMQQDIEDKLTPHVTTGETRHEKKDVFVANDCVKPTITPCHRDEVMHLVMVNGDPKTVVDEDLQRISDVFLSTDGNEVSLDSQPTKEYRDPQEISGCLNGNLFLSDSIADSHLKQEDLRNICLSPTQTVTSEADQDRTAGIYMSTGSFKDRYINSDCELTLDEMNHSGVVQSELSNHKNQCDIKDGETATQNSMNRKPSDIDDYCKDVEGMLEEGWQTGCQRHEVYGKSHARRSLFKATNILKLDTSEKNLNHHYLLQSMSLIDKNNWEQSESLHIVCIQQEEPLIEKTHKMLAVEKEALVTVPEDGNQVQTHQFQEPENTAENINSSPALLGKKRRVPLITGMERAHFEENQNGRKKNHKQDWEPMRKKTLGLHDDIDHAYKESVREEKHKDSVNWEAVHHAKVEELADTIKERGMHHVLSGRIKAFLKTVHHEHGSIDLEWLRKLSPEDAKAYLMSIHGLGVKSVECIRLLTLHHVAFPVDVNVGRICVRLGWVPIEPLPEELQLHLLEMYPVQETIQKYLWPRLCTLDQKALYEFHYQLITFGKVFCTKSKPNCNACPMKTECKHFASAYASAKPLLTAPDSNEDRDIHPPLEAANRNRCGNMLLIHSANGQYLEQNLSKEPSIYEVSCNTMSSHSDDHIFFVEEPASPEQANEHEVADIEDFPFIYENLDDFTDDLLKAGNVTRENEITKTDNISFTYETDKQGYTVFHSSMHSETNYYKADTFCHERKDEKSTMNSGTLKQPFVETSKHQSMQVDFPIPHVQPPFKVITNYGIENKDVNTTGEALDDVKEAHSAIVPLPSGAHLPAPKLKNISRLRTIHYAYELPDNHLLLEKFTARERDDPSPYLLAIWSPEAFAAEEVVSGTLLIPCRTAMGGSFPLNGTYFQVNEVFADHESSLQPFQVQRSQIWNLQRRFVYFGSSVTNISKGLSTSEIRSFFLHGYVCVRGFDRKTRSPKPLICRLHFPASKQTKSKKTPSY